MRAPPPIAAGLVWPQLDTRFQPQGLLRNAHLQSILPSVPPLRSLTRRRAAALVRGARAWVIDCGDGVRLQGFHTPRVAAWPPPGTVPADARPRRIAVLLHGWEGSAGSAHVLSLGERLWREGFDVVRLNLRDHGATHHLNRDIFHSCRLQEVVGALRGIAAHFPQAPLYLAGFSLGGNFLLRAAADPGLPAGVAGVAAVSPLLDPATTLRAMEQGRAVYRRYFVRCWSNSLRTKGRAWPATFDFGAALRSADLREMTQLLLAHTPFERLEDYQAGYAITGQRLDGLRIPAALLLSQDDPIIPAADIACLAACGQLQVTLTRHGGHCGFLDGWLQPSFAERYVLEQFARFGAAT